MEHLMDRKNGILVRIPDLKNKVVKKFAIGGVFADIVRKYKQLRPSQMSTDRFFVYYRKGRCMAQVIGRNTITKMPQRIAEFLKFPDATRYTVRSIQKHNQNMPSIFAGTGVTIEKLTTSDAEGKIANEYELTIRV